MKVALPNNKEMQHGRIVELRAHFGDWVDKGQEVMLIQIHERTIVFNSPQAGILASTVPVGHQPEPGSLLFLLKPQDEIHHYKTKKVTLTNSKEMLHGRIVELRAQAGDSVEKGQAILVMQIHDRTLVFSSPQSGIIESMASMGHQPEPGSLLFSLRLPEEQSDSKNPEPTNATINNKPVPPSNREGPTDIKKPKPSDKKASGAGIVMLTVGIVALTSLWWFYWHDQNVVIMSCKVSEYVDIRQHRYGEKGQGEISYHFYDHREKENSLLSDREYKISVDSTRSPSLHILGEDSTAFGWFDDAVLCDSTAKNCESSLTTQGASFIKTDNIYRINSQLSSHQDSDLSYEFNYVDKTLYTTVNHQKGYGTFHIFYRCTDNSY